MQTDRSTIDGCGEHSHLDTTMWLSCTSTSTSFLPVAPSSSRPILSTKTPPDDGCLRCVRLQFPGAPCLSVGTSARPVGLPPEVCRLKKGQRKLKLDDRQTAEARKPRS